MTYLVFFLLVFNCSFSNGQGSKVNIEFIDYFFENASPLGWEVLGDTIVKISLMPDYDRETLNCQTDHWHFKLEAEKGTQMKFILSKLVADVYNGKKAKNWWNFEHDISCYISYDHKTWRPVKTSKLPDHELLVEFKMEEAEVYVANIPPYTISDLDTLKKKIENNPLVKIFNIGETVEKRPLEIIQLGNPAAPYSILIRARAHPWEPGGNWVVEGLIEEFISHKSKKWQKSFCIYIMPMANKDGVARGMTRFNVRGKDLNRNWDVMSDPELCPEKYVLEKFIEELIDKGRKPCFAIDFHNDNDGNIHTARHRKDETSYLDKLLLFEKLLRKHTSFSEGITYSWKTSEEQNTISTFQNGLEQRYNIDAIVFELNANWIASLNKVPEAKDWIAIGENLNTVFFEYLKSVAPD